MEKCVSDWVLHVTRCVKLQYHLVKLQEKGAGDGNHADYNSTKLNVL